MPGKYLNLDCLEPLQKSLFNAVVSKDTISEPSRIKLEIYREPPSKLLSVNTKSLQGEAINLHQALLHGFLQGKQQRGK